MKLKLSRILCPVLALLLALNLCACGGNDPVEAGRHYNFGDYEVVYKSACIMPDDEGKDSFVVYFDFTNNSKSAGSYGWTIFEKVTQGNTQLEPSFVITNLETLDYIGETAFNDIEPGVTVEVSSSYQLSNTTDQIKLNISDLFDKYSYDLTFEPSELGRVEPQTGAGASTSGEETSGDTQGFGDFVSVLVPEGYTFERCSWNEENPHYISIEKSDWVYFNLNNYTTEEEMTADYNYVKKTYTNEQVDVSATYGGIDWIGFQYGDGFGGYCLELYAIIGTNYLRVDSAGLAFDDPTVGAVLGSIVMVGGDAETSESGDDTGNEAGNGTYLDWWNGDWYGWWIITDGTGTYEGYTSYFWDLCGKLEIANEENGCFTLWDPDYSYDEPSALILVSFSEAGVGSHGTMFSENGTFYDQTLGHADWIVDPGLEIVDDLLWIDGTYDGDEGSYSYEIYLRPWGVSWDDLPEDAIPYADPLPGSYDWYTAMITSGEPMPNAFS